MPATAEVHPVARLAVIGDVGGQFTALLEALCALGFDPTTSRLPDDLTVVQVGDLVHRGPDSDDVVSFVDAVMAENGHRWVQLAGNHEAQYLFPPAFQWPETVSPTTATTLRRWWADGTMVAAAAFSVRGVPVRRRGGRIETVGAGGLLVTHAGLTLGCWDALGNPPTAQAAAAAINDARFDRSGPVWRPGQMLTRYLVHDAGPVWAEPTTELYLPWIRSAQLGAWDGGCLTPGFHQAHGHASAFRWDAGRWSRADLADVFSPASHVDTERRQLRITAGEQTLWGVDPTHGRYPALRWAPLVLDLDPADPATTPTP
jgi:hypothetical protein